MQYICTLQKKRNEKSRVRIWDGAKMTWINVVDDLPKAFEVVWIWWRDREVLLGCKTTEHNESEPSESWYSFEDEKCRWAHWWKRIDCSNLDKPKPPNYD